MFQTAIERTGDTHRRGLMVTTCNECLHRSKMITDITPAMTHHVGKKPERKNAAERDNLFQACSIQTSFPLPVALSTCG